MAKQTQIQLEEEEKIKEVLKELKEMIDKSIEKTTEASHYGVDYDFDKYGVWITVEGFSTGSIPFENDKKKKYYEFLDIMEKYGFVGEIREENLYYEVYDARFMDEIHKEHIDTGKCYLVFNKDVRDMETNEIIEELRSLIKDLKMFLAYS